MNTFNRPPSGGAGGSRPPFKKPFNKPFNKPPARPFGARPPFQKGQEQKQDADGFRINQQITSREIRLIDEEGNQVGVVPTAQGLTMAEKVGLDLVEVSPNVSPPVCKILDYGKFRYEAQKKAKEAKKKQKVVLTKEIRMRPTIDDNDYNVKMNSVKKFIAEGDKVKISVKFKGREMTHQEFGRKILDRVVADSAEYAKVEFAPKMEGKSLLMIITPK